MPVFAYTVMGPDGTKTKGTCRAADLQSAAAELRAAERYVLDLRETAAPATNQNGTFVLRDRLFGRLPVAARDQAQFFCNLGLMLRSGLPLLQALEIYGTHASRRRMMLASRRIAVAVQSGNGLSAALAAEKRLFPSFAIKMVATGEATGELDVMLDRIADYIEYKAELRNSLLTSLTYPALVVVITVAVVVFLVTNVIPKFMSILAARNITLPDTTQLLVDITDFANRYGATILMVVLVVAFVVVITYLTRPGRLLIDRVLLSLPIVGHVLTLAFIAHFGRTLAILIKSGLPVLEGLSLLGESTANRAFARHLKCAEQRLLDGKSLSQGLQAKIVPQILPALVSIGEASGNLDTVLDELGVFHERKLRSELKWVASLFEPVMILIVGGIVGFVYISFFQVLYQMSAR